MRSQAVLGAGVTCISVGHRPSLTAYHQQVLILGPGGGAGEGGSWQIKPAAEAAKIVADAAAAVA